jgi:hypothetical protein
LSRSEPDTLRLVEVLCCASALTSKRAGCMGHSSAPCRPKARKDFEVVKWCYPRRALAAAPVRGWRSAIGVWDPAWKLSLPLHTALTDRVGSI